jgi:hypothetical protein
MGVEADMFAQMMDTTGTAAETAMETVGMEGMGVEKEGMEVEVDTQMGTAGMIDMEDKVKEAPTVRAITTVIRMDRGDLLDNMMEDPPMHLLDPEEMVLLPDQGDHSLTLQSTLHLSQTLLPTQSPLPPHPQNLRFQMMWLHPQMQS